MLVLFKPFVSELPMCWFSEMHTSIATAKDLSELQGFHRAIDAELGRFGRTRKQRAALIMLLAYCNLRINLIKKSLKK